MRAHLDKIVTCDAVVVVAGFEGALPSVVGGYVPCPVIGVPTSVGYGASFGGVASLYTAWRYPELYGSLLLQSGSFAFTDIGPQRRGPVFEPVVGFVNAFRDEPGRPVDRNSALSVDLRPLRDREIAPLSRMNESADRPRGPSLKPLRALLAYSRPYTGTL